MRSVGSASPRVSSRSLLGLSLKELIRVMDLAHPRHDSTDNLCQPPSPARSAADRSVTRLSPASGTIRLSDDSSGLTSHFALRLIGSLIPAPPGNQHEPSWGHVQIFRTVPSANTLVRWVNENAFASIVQARPCPTFGRPVHQRGRPLDYGPVLLLKPFGFHLAVDTLSSGVLRQNLGPSPWLFPSFPTLCPFRVLLIRIPASEALPPLLDMAPLIRAPEGL